jgi:hypothetical protein
MPRGRRRTRERRSLRIIQGSLSARKVQRQSPLLAGLHRIATGALAGLGISMLGLSALTFHWQNEWARSYAHLESSRMLEHRTEETSALLERHHLSTLRQPGQLVPTSSNQLIHLSQPGATRNRAAQPLLPRVQLGFVPAGY